MLLAVDDNPTVIGAAVRCAMRVVNARRELVRVAKERLPISENLRVGGRSHHAIQIVIRDHFDELIAAVRKFRKHGVHVMAAVRAGGLIARMTCGDSAHHHVIDIVRRAGGDQARELCIHIGRAGGGNLRRCANRSR